MFGKYVTKFVKIVILEILLVFFQVIHYDLPKEFFSWSGKMELRHIDEGWSSSQLPVRRLDSTIYESYL